MSRRLALVLELVSLATGVVCAFALADELTRGGASDRLGELWRRYSGPYARVWRIEQEWRRGRHAAIWEAIATVEGRSV